MKTNLAQPHFLFPCLLLVISLSFSPTCMVVCFTATPPCGLIFILHLPAFACPLILRVWGTVHCSHGSSSTHFFSIASAPISDILAASSAVPDHTTSAGTAHGGSCLTDGQKSPRHNDEFCVAIKVSQADHYFLEAETNSGVQFEIC